jgi:hypothetical protein
MRMTSKYQIVNRCHMKSKIFILLVASLVFGLASANDQLRAIEEHIKKEECFNAEQLAKNYSGTEEDRIFAVGLVYLECHEKEIQGISIIERAARQGSAEAKTALRILSNNGYRVGVLVPKNKVSNQAPVTQQSTEDFKKCMSAARSAAIQCTLRCSGVGGNCHQICDDRKIAQTDRCEARLKGIPYQYNPPVQSQPNVVVPQQRNTLNPNVCIQDGGGAYCPNHPNTQRRDPLRGPAY